MKNAKRLLAAGLTVGLLTLATALPAFAAGTAVQVGRVSLVARGAGVDVTVAVTCDPYTDYWGSSMTSTPVQVTLTEALRRGNLTTGSGTGVAVCDSTPHGVTVLVVASGYAFARGPALVWVTPTFDSASTPPVVSGATVRIH